MRALTLGRHAHNALRGTCAPPHHGVVACTIHGDGVVTYDVDDEVRCARAMTRRCARALRRGRATMMRDGGARFDASATMMRDGGARRLRRWCDDKR